MTANCSEVFIGGINILKHSPTALFYDAQAVSVHFAKKTTNISLLFY
jgi:hypothetical protein